MVLARKMTSKARSLGMKSTTFKTRLAFPIKVRINCARHGHSCPPIITSQYYHYFSKKNFKYRGKSYRNHNKLLKTLREWMVLNSGIFMLLALILLHRLCRIIADCGCGFMGDHPKQRTAICPKLWMKGLSARKLPRTRLALRKYQHPRQNQKSQLSF